MPRSLRQYDIKFSFSQVSLTLAKIVVDKMVSLFFFNVISKIDWNYLALSLVEIEYTSRKLKLVSFFRHVINLEKSKFWGAMRQIYGNIYCNQGSSKTIWINWLKIVGDKQQFS